MDVEHAPGEWRADEGALELSLIAGYAGLRGGNGRFGDAGDGPPRRAGGCACISVALRELGFLTGGQPAAQQFGLSPRLPACYFGEHARLVCETGCCQCLSTRGLVISLCLGQARCDDGAGIDFGEELARRDIIAKVHVQLRHGATRNGVGRGGSPEPDYSSLRLQPAASGDTLHLVRRSSSRCRRRRRIIRRGGQRARQYGDSSGDRGRHGNRQERCGPPPLRAWVAQPTQELHRVLSLTVFTLPPGSLASRQLPAASVRSQPSLFRRRTAHQSG